ncbi:MAG TPA: hypothetical protein PLW80_06005 [Spirochaetales bacterium]|nr:hypothetical protein [Spirochaetales bacterium]
MDLRRYLGLYAVSPLGLAMSAASVAVGAAVGFAASPLAGVAACLVTEATAFAITTASGLGPKAAVAEGERRAWAEASERLEAVKRDRDRLATMRLPDDELGSLVRLAATRGASYLAASRNAKSRVPQAEEALSDCLSVADLYLKELDAASTERRHGLDDADPFADAKGRAKAALVDKAAIIEKATRDLSGGLSSADAMDIKERL